jgi:hypothetical protein
MGKVIDQDDRDLWRSILEMTGGEQAAAVVMAGAMVARQIATLRAEIIQRIDATIAKEAEG